MAIIPWMLVNKETNLTTLSSRR